MPTLEITNFGGSTTRYVNGDINSGKAKYGTSNSYDSYTYPGSITWFEQPVQIDSAGSVITDMIVAGQVRVESGITYVYAIGHTGRLYKIQVNDPTTYNPNYDNPVLLATLTSNSPTFTRGGSLDFYGATERIYIGHDKGVTRIDFNGANETFVGVLGSWTQNVPRQSKQFLGKLYYGNGSNIAEIDTTAAVTSYAKLSPGFPTNSQVRDIDVSPDGVYLEMVVSLLALADITATAPDTSSIANSESYVFKWNGTDAGYTSFVTYPSFSLTANTAFGSRQYVFGIDTAGACVFNPTEKILTLLLSQSPLPNAVSVNGNVVGWTVSEFVQGFTKGTLYLYGPLDASYPGDYFFRQQQFAATGTETNVIRAPFVTLVSTFNIGNAANGYAGGVFGNGKIYYSTLETSSGTTKYKFYKCFTVSTGVGTPTAGVYETQNQLFSKKINVSEVRLYTRPLIAGNAFTAALIGSDGNPISGGSYTFTVGSNVTAGEDRIRYNPSEAPTYSLGLRITNSGSTNWTLVKAEIDWDYAGK